MSARYQSVIAGAFVEFLDRGYVYKGLKPVHWCMKDRTALAEAEVEYKDHSSPSIWVRFKLVSDPAKIHPSLAGRNVYGLIWTTTPWTIPANMAIAFNPKFEYVAVKVESGDVYMVAAGLLEVTAEKCGWRVTEIVARFTGDKLEARRFPPSLPGARFTGHSGRPRHPRTGHRRGAYRSRPWPGGLRRRTPVRHRDLLPGGWRRPLLPRPRRRRAPARGAYRQDRLGSQPHRHRDSEIGGRAAGHGEAGPLLSALLALPPPHHLPRHRAVVHRHGPQRFPAARPGCRSSDALDAILGRGTYRQHDRHAARLVHLAPARVGRSDHRLLLRQVPRALTDRKILDGIVELFREHTADVWYERTAAELLPPGMTCPNAAAAEFSKENDILDVWFDSGSSHLAVLNERFGLSWPADVYMEGGDQYRGWFHSSLLVGVGIKGGSPYRACASNGWVLDGEGRAMHKSLGNSIEPEEVIKHYGAEILRLWSASVDFHEDVRISETILTPPGGRLPQAAQHVPLPAGQSGGFRSGAGFRAGRRAARDRSMDSAARRRPGGALPRLVRQLRVPQGLSLGLRFRHGGSERHLLRRAQGPALYLRRQVQGAPRGADRALPPAGCAGAPGGAHHELHRRRGLEPHGRGRQACTRRCFPEPDELDRRVWATAHGDGRPTGTVSWKCGTASSRAWKPRATRS